MTDRLYTWLCKPALRVVYHDLYSRIATARIPGLTLEIGSGINNLKAYMPDIISSDIHPGCDMITDAMMIPFRDVELANIIMVDVMHHVEYLDLFFHEAVRCLQPQGRIIAIEPAITLGSTLFYRLFHHEVVDMSSGLWTNPTKCNQAIPTLVATAHPAIFPGLHIIQVRWLSLWAYPLCGGFRDWSLLTRWLALALLRIERPLERSLGRWLGFRVMIVIERQSL